LPEEQREDLLRRVALGEEPLEERDCLAMATSDDRLRELEDVRLDRATHQRAHVRGAHRRSVRVCPELLHLVLDALGIGTQRERERVHRVGLQDDFVQTSARADPAPHLERHQALDTLRPSADRLHRIE